MLGRGRKHFILRILKISNRTLKYNLESYHFVLARKQSTAKSRLAVYGRLLLTKNSFYKLNTGDLTHVHFLTFDYKRFYKLLASPIKRKIEIDPRITNLLGLTYYDSKSTATKFKHLHIQKNYSLQRRNDYKLYSSS